MQKQRKGSQETIAQPWGKILVPPQGIYITITSSFSAGTNAPTQVKDGNFRLITRSLLPHCQPIGRTSWTLQPSPQILPIKNVSLKTIKEFGSFEHEPPILLEWLFNKPFCAPNSDLWVCLASLYVGHIELEFNNSARRSAFCDRFNTQGGAPVWTPRAAVFNTVVSSSTWVTCGLTTHSTKAKVTISLGLIQQLKLWWEWPLLDWPDQSKTGLGE